MGGEMSRDGYLPPGCTQQQCDEAQPGYWDEEPPPKRGRPLLEPGKPRADSITFRLRRPLGAQLRKTAAENGRSLAQEIVWRLEMSFLADKS
jgi:hypothetical protein